MSRKKNKSPLGPSAVGGLDGNFFAKYEKVLAAALVFMGVFLMVLGARGDLWFDEILSFQWANNATSMADLLRLFRHDNNHPLNSAWLYLLGEGHAPVLYRLPAIVAGGISLLMVYFLGKAFCPRMALLPLFLAAFSYPLVLYGSEARGFSMAVAASLVGPFLLLKYGEKKPPLPGVVLFWLSCTVGMLAHGSFLTVLLGLFLWRGVVVLLTKESRWSALFHLGVWFAIPSALAVSYYLYYLRPMLVAGGPEYPLSLVLTHFFGYLLGLPVAGFPGLISMVFGVALLLIGSWVALEPAPRPLVFYGCLLVLAPAVSLLAGRGEFIYFRYFLVLAPFFYLLVGIIAAVAVPRWPRMAPVVLVLAMTGFFIGQVPRLVELLVYGRGGYTAALEKIVQEPGTNKILITDHDMRNGLVVEFHRRRSPSIRQIRYFPEWEFAEKLRDLPDWILTHQMDSSPAPPAAVDFRQQPYGLVNHYRTAPVSGFHWFLYKKIPTL